MKQKMSLRQKIDLTRDGTAEMTRWCIIIALHQGFGVGSERLRKIERRTEELGYESLSVAMTANDRGMPSTDKSLAMREGWLPDGVEPEFRVPILRAPKNRKEQQLRMAGNQAAGMVWTLYAKACMDVLGYGTKRLTRLREEALTNYRQVNEEGHECLEWAMERLRKCAEDALKEDVVVQEVPDEERVKQSDRDYMAQKEAFFRRNMAAAMGRKLAPAGAAVLSEKGLDEKLQQLARLQQDGSGRPEELNRTWMGRKEGKAS